MKKSIIPLFLICFVLLSVNMVLTAPSKTVSISGLTVEAPIIEFHQYNTSFDFYAHVFNTTSGLMLTNTTVSCYAHLYNRLDGEHLYAGSMPYINSSLRGDFEASIKAGNFTTIGQYSIIYWCNSSTEGGFLEYPFYVNMRGLGLETSEALIYIALTFFVFVLICVFVFASFKIPFSNKVNNLGEVLAITKMKYYKLVFIALSYPLILWFFNLLIGISDSYATMTMYYGLFSFIFTSMINLSWVFFIVIIIIAVWNIIKDFQFDKLLKDMEKPFK